MTLIRSFQVLHDAMVCAVCERLDTRGPDYRGRSSPSSNFLRLASTAWSPGPGQFPNSMKESRYEENIPDQPQARG